jgi:hypothetical protein
VKVLIGGVVVLVRGSSTDRHPYDFLDVGEKGWPSVLSMVGLVVALALAALLIVVDSRRTRDTSPRH